MFCANCGTKSVDGGRFCQNCGTPVVGAPSAAPVSQPQKPPPPYPGQPQVLKAHARLCRPATGCCLWPNEKKKEQKAEAQRNAEALSPAATGREGTSRTLQSAASTNWCCAGPGEDSLVHACIFRFHKAATLPTRHRDIAIALNTICARYGSCR